MLPLSVDSRRCDPQGLLDRTAILARLVGDGEPSPGKAVRGAEAEQQVKTRACVLPVRCVVYAFPETERTWMLPIPSRPLLYVAARVDAT